MSKVEEMRKIMESLDEAPEDMDMDSEVPEPVSEHTLDEMEELYRTMATAISDFEHLLRTLPMDYRMETRNLQAYAIAHIKNALGEMGYMNADTTIADFITKLRGSDDWL